MAPAVSLLHTMQSLEYCRQKNNNIRDKLVYKLLAGYQMYLCLMGKNYIFEKKMESRYMEVLIVCNLQESNSPIDKDGLRYIRVRRYADTRYAIRCLCTCMSVLYLAYQRIDTLILRRAQTCLTITLTR